MPAGDSADGRRCMRMLQGASHAVSAVTDDAQTVRVSGVDGRERESRGGYFWVA
jgi:hypothetical protein